jgi:hypothetical protein
MAGHLIMGATSGFAVKAELNSFVAEKAICSAQRRQASEGTGEPVGWATRQRRNVKSRGTA